MHKKDDKPSIADDEDLRFGYPGAMRLTGLPAGTLYAKVARKQIPHIRLGKRLVRFSRRELLEWLAQHSVPARNP